MIVLAKVEDGGLYPDLVNAGYTSGHVIKCPNPDCEQEYRVFYGQEPKTVTHQAMSVPALEDAVENSHPQHPDRIQVA